MKEGKEPNQPALEIVQFQIVVAQLVTQATLFKALFGTTTLFSQPLLLC